MLSVGAMSANCSTVIGTAPFSIRDHVGWATPAALATVA
jgi:hypothetical protein